MKNKLLFCIALCTFILNSFYSSAQVSAYTFAGSSGTFTSIVGGSGTVVITTTSDDDNYGTFPVGFTFNYNGNDFTTFGLNANGFISLGYVPVTTNNCLSSGLNNNVISGFNNDLYGVAAGSQISYQTSGSSGSKVLTIEWTNWGFCCNGLNEFNFQIKLFETSNKIQTVYGSCPGTTTKTLQIGLRGASNADFNNRSTTTNWAATVAGGVNSATCTFSSTIKPTSGQTFEWTPPPPGPRTVGTITSVQQTGTAAPGTTGNTILRVDIPVTGALGTITLNSITVTSKNTNDNDVATGGVNVWIGTSSGPTTLVGIGATFSAGAAVVSSIASSLITGTNYIWITYDLKSTAIVNNVLDLRILVGGMSLTASGGANAPGTQPTVALNPSGNKTVGYCVPVSTSGGCGGDQLAGFTYAGITYSTGACLSAPAYLDVATVATATQGQTNSFTITNGDLNDYAAVWMDFNDNNSFDDAGELLYSGGPGTSLIGTMTIPLTAAVGTHRIRVRNNYGAVPASSCGTQTYGETKDFRISVLLATNCSGAPAASTTLSTNGNVCAGVSFTLSLGTVYTNLGISYIWQSSADNITYTDISGATSFNYTTTLSSSKYYRCKISCSFSGQSTNSTPLLVTLNPFNNCYCTPASTDCSDDKITSVVFGTISNTGSGCSVSGYGNYTNLTAASVSQGSTQSASIGVSSGGTEYVSLWIDYNHNAVFDADERTFIGSGFGTTLTTNVLIPANALTGITRMRVRLEFAFEPMDPCEAFLYGETEDYFVNITGCTNATYYADADADTYGNPLSSIVACSPPLGYVSNNTDCNDANAAIHPNATEICNTVDDDCDNAIDEGLTLFTYYLDVDADGYGVATTTTTTCQASPPSGYATNSTDCNDANSAVHPNAPETCNSIDDDCDNAIDEGLPLNTYYRDLDADTYGNLLVTTSTCSAIPPSGYVSNSTDCNDANGAVHPNATETCNSIDDDCDNAIDEGLPLNTYYLDADNDTYGKLSSSIAVCQAVAPSGYVSNSTDCNDANAAIHPNATETCNSIDDDCDNLVDEGLTQFTYYADADADTYGNINSSTTTCQASAPSGYVTNSTDCNDANSNIKPSATELCNSIDDDCDNLIDEGLTQFTYYADTDADTYGNINSSTTTCQSSAPSGYVTNSTDCNDANAAVNPNATEICNSIDDDCDNQIDEGIVSASITTPNGATSFCSGSSLTMQANTGFGFTYQWIKDGSNVSGATASSYTTSTAGTFTVKVSLGACNATSDGTTLTVNALPTATITPTGTIKTCSPDPATMFANTGVGLSYQWSDLIGTIAGATNSSYTTTVTSTYTVKVTDANTCTKVSAGKVFKNYAKATAKITVVGSLNICTTGSVTFNATVKSGYFYQWYKDDAVLAGATTSTYIATVTGVYKYLATTKDGCTKFSATKTVTGCKLGDQENNFEDSELTLFPNPSDGLFNVQLIMPDNYSGDITIEITNAIGQLVRKENSTIANGKFEESINFGTAIPAGMYLMRVITGNNIFEKRFIINR
jgi:hypothetical protein